MFYFTMTAANRSDHDHLLPAELHRQSDNYQFCDRNMHPDSDNALDWLTVTTVVEQRGVAD